MKDSTDIINETLGVHDLTYEQALLRDNEVLDTDISNETLGVVEEVINPVAKEPVKYDPANTELDDIDNDYKYQRQNFYSLIEQGQNAIEGILEIAKESEHPRTYEVVGQLIKSVAEVTEKLGDLQAKMKKLKDVPNIAPKNVTNALFVGSTAELQRMLKGKKND